MQNMIQGTGIGHYGLLDIKVMNTLGYIHVITETKLKSTSKKAEHENYACSLGCVRMGEGAKIPEGIQGTEIIKQKKYMQRLLGLLHWRGRPTREEGVPPPP